ncbi:AMP-binding protein [Streptomyces macrosporus]|uniref:AMP-binding protein n=1 Tax=Streptomyces macrosporus TaxID=44032 RepID=UPI0031DCC476
MAGGARTCWTSRSWTARGHRGRREALVGGGRVLTRAELDAAVSGCAARLARCGTHPGENVLVQLPNQPQLVILVLALIRLGTRPVLAPPTLREHELAPVLSSVRPGAMAVPVRRGRPGPRPPGPRRVGRSRRGGPRGERPPASLGHRPVPAVERHRRRAQAHPPDARGVRPCHP